MTRRFIARHLRHRLGRPLLPPRHGDGVLPWVSGPDLRTRYLLNGAIDPVLRDQQVEVSLTQFDRDGMELGSFSRPVGHGQVTVLELPQSQEFNYGYCLVRNSGPRPTIPMHHHLEIVGQGSYAVTHGRSNGIYHYGTVDLLDGLLRLLDPVPFSWFAGLLPPLPAQHGFLIFNLSDRVCDLRYRARGGQAVRREIAPHGSYLLFETQHGSELPRIDFEASAPFTFYIAMMRADGAGLTLQHINQAI